MVSKVAMGFGCGLRADRGVQVDWCKFFRLWWPGTELNRRRQPFQGCALPPELPGHSSKACQDEPSAKLPQHAGTGKGLPATRERSIRVRETVSIITTGRESLKCRPAAGTQFDTPSQTPDKSRAGLW